MFGFPTSSAKKGVWVYNATSNSTVRTNSHVWVKPPEYSEFFIMVIGAGAGGTAGVVSNSTTIKAMTQPGSTGSLSMGLYSSWMLPPVLYINVANGGIGSTSSTVAGTNAAVTEIYAPIESPNAFDTNFKYRPFLTANGGTNPSYPTKTLLPTSLSSAGLYAGWDGVAPTVTYNTEDTTFSQLKYFISPGIAGSNGYLTPVNFNVNTALSKYMTSLNYDSNTSTTYYSIEPMFLSMASTPMRGGTDVNSYVLGVNGGIVKSSPGAGGNSGIPNSYSGLVNSYRGGNGGNGLVVIIGF